MRTPPKSVTLPGRIHTRPIGHCGGSGTVRRKAQDAGRRKALQIAAKSTAKTTPVGRITRRWFTRAAAPPSPSRAALNRVPAPPCTPQRTPTCTIRCPTPRTNINSLPTPAFAIHRSAAITRHSRQRPQHSRTPLKPRPPLAPLATHPAGEPIPIYDVARPAGPPRATPTIGEIADETPSIQLRPVPPGISRQNGTRLKDLASDSSIPSHSAYCPFPRSGRN